MTQLDKLDIHHAIAELVNLNEKTNILKSANLLVIRLACICFAVTVSIIVKTITNPKGKQ